MHKRKLKELNLLDDFLFYSMVSHPKFGDEFSRKLLKILFNRDFNKLKVVPQKIYYGVDTDKHGTRLDVYLEEEINGDELIENATIFDIEPENNSKLENIVSLPKRIRFYHSTIDSRNLESGADYHSLKRVIVIMITPFDPFGYDQIVYTIQNGCVEVPELEYDDGAKTIFLYTEGKNGDTTQVLREFLKYMKNTKAENAANETLKEIHSMVESVKEDSEVSWRYMKIFERERMIREEAAQQERINTERERERADEEKARADAEKNRADKMEEENQRLRKELARLKGV